MTYREAPNNIEAEQALLGALLVNNEAYYAVADFLRPVDFYEPLHRRIFDTAGELIRMGKSANPVTIKTFLPADAKLGDMTVAQYLARLAAEAVTIINAVDYGRAIYDLAMRRALIVAGEALVNEAFDMPVESNPDQLGERAIDQIVSACAGSAGQDAVTFGEAITTAIDLANSAYMRDGVKQGGVSIGDHPLTRLVGPMFFGGQLIIIGGGTKQGKTALVGQVAVGAACEGTPVDFYSGEMTAAELAMREISRRVGVPVRKQKRGELNEQQMQQMLDVQRALKDCPIHIQNRRLTLPQLKERWRRVVRKRGKCLLIVDHIGLLERDKATSKMSNWEFGEEVTRELKATARDLDCPVIACGQLKKNTFVDNKAPLNEKFLDSIIRRKPRYSDLIGAVERDADHVIIPFRPDVFLMEHEPTPGSELYPVWEFKVNEWRGKAQLVLALSREMQWPAHVTVGWDGNSTSFFETGESRLPDRFADDFRKEPLRLF